jgi:hypothetical protein
MDLYASSSRARVEGCRLRKNKGLSLPLPLSVFSGCENCRLFSQLSTNKYCGPKTDLSPSGPYHMDLVNHLPHNLAPLTQLIRHQADFEPEACSSIISACICKTTGCYIPNDHM